ncbi:MAG: hypothetical protein WEB06_19575 [Actinomycetota bacterium]
MTDKRRTEPNPDDPPQSEGHPRERFRAWLLEQIGEAHREYDKLITALAAGALGLSIAFLDRIVSGPVKSPALLAVAWGALAASLLSTLISFISAQQALQYRYLEIEDDAPAEPGNKANKRTTRFNYAAAGFFIGGVIFLGWFSYANLEKGEVTCPRKVERAAERAARADLAVTPAMEVAAAEGLAESPCPPSPRNRAAGKTSS